MNKVLVIVGPTAVGKTSLSLELAKRYQGEIISGDSIQIYRGFDIGSAKIKEEEKLGIKHYGIDELDPKDKTSVFDFQQRARNQIEVISKQKKLPMIVGGTGLYIKAVLYDYTFMQHSDIDLMKQAEYEAMDSESLHAILTNKDSEAAKSIHPHNRKRVIRALMIAHQGDLNKSEQIAQQQHQLCYDALIICCSMERKQLYARIEERVYNMVEAGLLVEIEQLLNKGINFKDQPMQGIGYKEWQAYFEHTKTKEEVIQEIIKHSKLFAKRQMTWFNHQFAVEYANMMEENWKVKLLAKIDDWMVSEWKKA